MLIPRFAMGLLVVGFMLVGAGVASGQSYPTKPLRIVTAGVEGSNDFIARLIAQGISGLLGQSVIVENQKGTIMAAQTAAKATPDGYTLLVNGSSLWIAPVLQNTPYDPVIDFSPITLTSRGPNILVVHPSVAVKSVKELIALAHWSRGCR